MNKIKKRKRKIEKERKKSKERNNGMKKRWKIALILKAPKL